MKSLLIATLAGALAGCAAQPWRFGDTASHSADLDRTSFEDDHADPDNRRQSFAESRSRDHAVQSVARPTTDNASPIEPIRREYGLVDSVAGRLPSLVSGTMFDPMRSFSSPPAIRFSQEAPNDSPYPVIAASYSDNSLPQAANAFEQPARGDVVYLPDPVNNRFQPGGPPIFVGVQGQDGNAVNVVIDDQTCGQRQPSMFSRFMDRPIVYNLVNDERNFYSCCSLEWLAVGLGTSAILANTNLDEQFRQAVHGPSNAHSTDLNWAKGFGTGQYVIPSLVAIWAADYWIDSAGAPGEHPCAAWLEEWSGRSLRGLVVGAVPLLTLQYAIGSSRPGESSAGSHWKPFQDNNGVSGHAFVGAVPFWTAAQLTDNIPLEAGFYAMGTLAGISRIHTDSHYLSQVLMGWWIAGLSVAAVDCTELQKRDWQVMPMLMENGTGIGVMHSW